MIVSNIVRRGWRAVTGPGGPAANGAAVRTTRA